MVYKKIFIIFLFLLLMFVPDTVFSIPKYNEIKYVIQDITEVPEVQDVFDEADDVIHKVDDSIAKISSRSKTTYQYDDMILLAKIINAEALGEPYDGKVAVGNVVLNRAKLYKKNLRDVIFEKGQFNGTASRLFNIEPDKDCIKASIDALNGINYVEDATYFINLNYFAVRNRNPPNWVNTKKFIKTIGAHSFYK